MADNFFQSPLCQSRSHCADCRNRGENGRAWREYIAKTFDTKGTIDFECPYGVPWNFVAATGPDSTPIAIVEERPAPTAKRGTTLAAAILTGKYVSTEIVEERMATCRLCDFKRVNNRGVEWCGVCGCKVSATHRELTNLVAYEENLPKWGCKHPKRAEGKGWKR